jgi:hypothetical protein
MLGFVPGFGAIADVVNAGISAARGDYIGAGFSLAAAVPLIGDFAAAGKAIRSVTQVSRVSHSAAPVISAARVERAVANGGGRAGTEVVQRWMSQAELQATQTTGLLRGGRDGIHYATDAANTAAQRARLRLALPQTPQVRATLEVPGGAFSAPSRVQPKYDMPGGGMERTATGQIPVKILGVD